MILDRGMQRRLADNSNNNDVDYVFPNPFLTCNWAWDEDDSASADIVQNCFYVVPEYNDYGDPFHNAYWIASRCMWTSVYATTVDCIVSTDETQFDYHAKPVYYLRQCSVEQLTNGASLAEACQTGDAWVPTQECIQDCFTRRRHLEEGEQRMSELCEECYYGSSGAEMCTFSLPKQRQSDTALDYNGMAWSSSLLVVTMKDVYASGLNFGGSNGGSVANTVLYDIETEQPSLVHRDYAYGITFHCPSGSYTGSQMTRVGPGISNSGVSSILLYGVGVLLVVLGAALYFSGRMADRPMEDTLLSPSDNCPEGEENSASTIS